MMREQQHIERGKRASFDRRSGAVHGSGADAGGGGTGEEDYDPDPMAGSGAEPQGDPRQIDEVEPGLRNPRERRQA